MRKPQKKTEEQHTRVGSWFNGDDYETEVEYIVTGEPGSFAVRAVDRFDGEKGEVYDVRWDGDALLFGSTGPPPEDW